MKEKISITLNDKILRDVDSIVDNIIIRNRSQAIEYLIDKALKESKMAVILAGESRKRATKKIRKRYSLKINHLTIIERIIKKLADSGFKNIFIVADHPTLTNIFKIIGDGSDHNVKIEFVDEETPEGTGSAIKLLKGKIKKTFLVVYCDTLLDNIDLLELWRQHMQEKMIATILVNSPSFHSKETLPSSKILCGNVKIEGNKIVSFTEKPVPNKLDSSIFSRGIYITEPDIFSYPGKDIELEVFPELAKRRLLGGLVSSAEHFHIHTHEDLIKAREKFKNEH